MVPEMPVEGKWHSILPRPARRNPHSLESTSDVNPSHEDRESASAPPRACGVLVTAGPTHEPVDAVRFLSNRSSGRTGIAIAMEAARRGHPTTLLLGPVSESVPQSPSLLVERFKTTAQLQSLMATHWPRHALLVMAGAVADFIPRRLSSGKASRHDGPRQLTLDPAPDLLQSAAASRRPGQHLIGFALEPAKVCLKSARAKLERKGIDAIVANPLETMDATTITATLLLADGGSVEPPPDVPKTQFATWLWDELDRRFPV